MLSGPIHGHGGPPGGSKLARPLVPRSLPLLLGVELGRTATFGHGLVPHRLLFRRLDDFAAGSEPLLLPLAVLLRYTRTVACALGTSSVADVFVAIVLRYFESKLDVYGLPGSRDCLRQCRPRGLCGVPGRDEPLDIGVVVAGPPAEVARQPRLLLWLVRGRCWVCQWLVRYE